VAVPEVPEVPAIVPTLLMPDEVAAIFAEG